MKRKLILTKEKKSQKNKDQIEKKTLHHKIERWNWKPTKLLQNILGKKLEIKRIMTELKKQNMINWNWMNKSKTNKTCIKNLKNKI